MSEPTQEQLAKMIACGHENRCGGNDYHLCNDCGLMWDYRRETAGQGLTRLLAAEIARLQAQLAEATDQIVAMTPEIERLAQAEADRDAARAERDRARQQSEALERESKGRRAALMAMSDERRAEWIRRENEAAARLRGKETKG